jgi:hypothetical protein
VQLYFVLAACGYLVATYPRTPVTPESSPTVPTISRNLHLDQWILYPVQPKNSVLRCLSVESDTAADTS